MFREQILDVGGMWLWSQFYKIKWKLRSPDVLANIQSGLEAGSIRTNDSDVRPTLHTLDPDLTTSYLDEFDAFWGRFRLPPNILNRLAMLSNLSPDYSTLIFRGVVETVAKIRNSSHKAIWTDAVRFSCGGNIRGFLAIFNEIACELPEFLGLAPVAEREAFSKIEKIYMDAPPDLRNWSGLRRPMSSLISQRSA